LAFGAILPAQGGLRPQRALDFLIRGPPVGPFDFRHAVANECARRLDVMQLARIVAEEPGLVGLVE
jgi:hypothetical protein